ncbi:polysaccharide biosynthesis/export family protein [Plebeiibacterium marinum]|uniref:Polysaccharide biosynthesis/export family protein n=1 Tax=Plebeiibacterium marinum TaxID=2992111 RepID=A0AAE3SLQ2_9BACT|nr:polysaccharide biosynthesis/export family protein [Plebeiobacterium marinum]MCW3807714.1 polysaccharide biosynthesis/export family protein [Plebeiobacterium marinum]
MNIFQNQYWFIFLFVALFTSCIPQKETIYLQDKESEMEFKELTEITGKYILQTNDYLFIRVSTFDPKISEFFNTSQGNNINSSNLQNGSTLFMYVIDDEMNIDYPYAGKINLQGCNIFQAKAKIREALKPYVKDANILVRLGSNSYTILGEVKSPGTQRMTKDQITIFEAIGQAGDLTPVAKKRELTVVRPVSGGKSKTFKVDITDHKIIDSEYYYIYPNDFIYVKPMRAKQFGIGESFSLGVLSTLLSFTVTIIALTR